MGIPNYHKFIHETYPTAFRSFWLNTYDHVYIDINYALHYSSYGAKTKEELIPRLCKFIELVLIELSPTKTVTLAIDGSAPLAKLMVQKQRRSNISKTDGFGLLFTPGTIFMESLSEKLSGFFKYISCVFGVIVEFLGGKDEAELKIKRKIQHSSGTQICVSNDSDVIVMLSTLDNFKNIFMYDKKSNQVLSVCKLLELHSQIVKYSKGFNLNFALISILFGNDYLPKLEYINYENVWKASKNLNLINHDLTINRNHFILFLISIVKILKPMYVDKFDIADRFHPMYENYLDGLTWCLNMYYHGKCERYNYMYKFDKSPHPMGLLMYIKKYPKSILFNEEKFDHIDQALYPILLLPKVSLNLINEKYHDFANEAKILHQEEECIDCQKYIDVKCYGEKYKEMLDHKKTHTNISLDDIKTLVKKFEKLKFS